MTSDHGSVDKDHHLVQVARTLGGVVLPVRAMRPQGKAACERNSSRRLGIRAGATVRTLLTGTPLLLNGLPAGGDVPAPVTFGSR